MISNSTPTNQTTLVEIVYSETLNEEQITAFNDLIRRELLEKEEEEEERQRQQDINDYIEYCEEIEQIRLAQANAEFPRPNSPIAVWDNWGSQQPSQNDVPDINIRGREYSEINAGVNEIIESFRQDETQSALDEINTILREYEHQRAIDEMVEQLKQQDIAEIKERIENTKECAICIEQIDIMNNCVTPCGHKFCFTCILKSFSRNKTCPLCRADLNPNTPEIEQQQYMHLPNAYEENTQNMEYFNEYYDMSGNSQGGFEMPTILPINHGSGEINVYFHTPLS